MTLRRVFAVVAVFGALIAVTAVSVADTAQGPTTSAPSSTGAEAPATDQEAPAVRTPDERLNRVTVAWWVVLAIIVGAAAAGLRRLRTLGSLGFGSRSRRLREKASAT